MKKFIKKVVIFIIPIFILLFGVSFLADGDSDNIYLKFTSPQQKSLILGTSRAAQGIQPNVFKEILGIDIFNYAFNVNFSPYGKVYYESVLKKHKREKNGIFILTVDPWSISSFNKNPNDMDMFRENDTPIANMNFVNSSPNFEYLFKYFKGHYKNIIIDHSRFLYLHKDGWLDVSGLDMDSIAYNGRIQRTLEPFREIKTNLSQVRLDYLLKTVNYFKKYGEVYIVRLPVYPQMAEIDNKMMPNFEYIISEVIQNSDGYLDMLPASNRYKYIDSNHLHKESGAVVSQEIAEWIKAQRNLK